MSTRRWEYASWAVDGIFIGLGVICAFFGEWVVAWYLVLIAALSTFNRFMRSRRYFDGWIDGRQQLLRLFVHASNDFPHLDPDQRREHFIEDMIDTDLRVMRQQLGERATEKFKTEMLQHIARSDGSHDDLP